MASPTYDTTSSAQHAPSGDNSMDMNSFLVLEKPFDDARDPLDPHSYPTDLDITNLIGETSNDDPPPKTEERKSCRPWPKNNRSFEPSMDGRETSSSADTKSPITDATSLQRWKDESAVQGPYHDIDKIVRGDSSEGLRNRKRET